MICRLARTAWVTARVFWRTSGMVGTCGTEASKVINQSILLMGMFVELCCEGEEIDLGEFPLCRPVVALRVDLRRGGAAAGLL